LTDRHFDTGHFASSSDVSRIPGHGETFCQRLFCDLGLKPNVEQCLHHLGTMLDCCFIPKKTVRHLDLLSFEPVMSPDELELLALVGGSLQRNMTLTMICSILWGTSQVYLALAYTSALVDTHRLLSYLTFFQGFTLSRLSVLSSLCGKYDRFCSFA
jgi:hypothetical protein